MVRDIGVHRADDTALIDHLAEVWQRFADLNAALPMPRELERRRHKTSSVGFLVNLAGRLRVLVFLQRRFRVERVYVRRRAIHEQKNHPLGLGRKMWTKLRCAGSRLLAEQTGQAEVAETSGDPLEHVPAIYF